MSGAASYLVRRTQTLSDDLLSAVTPHLAGWAVAVPISWGSAPYRTEFRALWDTEALFLRYDVEDPHPWYTLTRRDDPLWEEEVVEIFLDPDAKGHHYAELEINPGNVVCDVRMIAPAPHRQMDLAWDIDHLHTRAASWPAGTYDGELAASGGWVALARVPFASLSSLPTAASLPPAPGDRWKFNVFRIKRPGGPLAPHADVILAAWSPTGGPSFHVPAAFRELVFG